MQESLEIFKEAKPLWQAHEPWSQAVAAERMAVDTAVLHFKSVTEQVALRGSPSKAGALPAGRVNPVPDFDLQIAVSS